MSICFPSVRNLFLSNARVNGGVSCTRSEESKPHLDGADRLSQGRGPFEKGRSVSCSKSHCSRGAGPTFGEANRVAFRDCQNLLRATGRALVKPSAKRSNQADSTATSAKAFRISPNEYQSSAGSARCDVSGRVLSGGSNNSGRAFQPSSGQSQQGPLAGPAHRPEVGHHGGSPLQGGRPRIGLVVRQIAEEDVGGLQVAVDELHPVQSFHPGTGAGRFPRPAWPTAGCEATPASAIT